MAKVSSRRRLLDAGRPLPPPRRHVPRGEGPDLLGFNRSGWRPDITRFRAEPPGTDPEAGPPATAGTGVAPTLRELRVHAESCPHNEPIPPEEPADCGCTRRCLAGLSTKAGGGVTWHDCWACPIAPRLEARRNPRPGGPHLR